MPNHSVAARTASSRLHGGGSRGCGGVVPVSGQHVEKLAPPEFTARRFLEKNTIEPKNSSKVALDSQAKKSLPDECIYSGKLRSNHTKNLVDTIDFWETKGHHSKSVQGKIVALF